MHSSVVFSIFIELCNHRHHLILEHFHPSKSKLVPVSRQSVLPTPPGCPTVVNLPSDATDLPVLDVVHTWNHRICGLLCLAFNERNSNKGFPYSAIASFLSAAEYYFFAWIYHIYLAIHQLACFHFLAIMNKTVVNIHGLGF